MENYQTTTIRMTPATPATCTLIEDLLPLYLEGEVSPGSRDLIVEHLGRCERCAGFLAGAQSVRFQLRREGIQRQSQLAATAPEGRTLRRWGRMLGGVMVLCFCLLGGVTAGTVSHGLYRGDSGALSGGVTGGLLIFALLAWLGRSYGPVSRQRLLLLAGGCALGGLGVFMLSAPFSNLLVLPGLAIGLLGVGAVWAAVLQKPARLS